MIIYKVFSIGIIKFLVLHCFYFLYVRNFMIDMLLFCKIYFIFLLLFTRFSILVLCNFFYSIIFLFLYVSNLMIDMLSFCEISFHLSYYLQDLPYCYDNICLIVDVIFFLPMVYRFFFEF